MTKTPEELTKDWKEGKLKSGLYWVKFKGKIVIAECTVFGDVSRPFEIETKTDFMIKISKVLAPVLTYDEYKAMQEQLNKEGTWYTEISYKKIKKENNQLRDLLRECRPYLSYKINQNKHVGFTPDAANLLTRINATLGESEE